MTKTKTPFSKLTKPQQRVEIAKDVLKQLKTNKIKPQTGTYVEFESKEINPNTQLQQILPEQKCTVCALGACLISTINKYNKLTLKDITVYSEYDDKRLQYNAHQEGVYDYLKKFFPFTQIQLIEFAFEQRLIGCWYYDYGNIKKAIIFGKKYKSPKTRIINIMNNIIKNNGTFVP